MRPVLFSVLGLDFQTYGLSKALAALVGAYLLGRAFQKVGLSRDLGFNLAIWATVWGFVGAKIYFLLEQFPVITAHHLAGSGFTWYGGLIGGISSALWIARRHHLPLATVAGAAAIPLTLAYGIGRIGCLLSGDGTYGRPTDVPWGMAFPHGVVPTMVAVHPTPLYEAIAALFIAAALWAIARRWHPGAVFGAYLVLSGISRFLVEYLRINKPVVVGLTQPQLWALLGMIVGVAIIFYAQRSPSGPATERPSDKDALDDTPHSNQLSSHVTGPQ